MHVGSGGALVEAWRELQPLSRLSKRQVKTTTVSAVHSNEKASFNGARTLPQKYLISDAIFAEEQARIFSKHWVCVGHQNDIAIAGDYFRVEISAESVLIVRDQFGKLRAFYNICRHRGTRLCEENKGHFRQTIQCPYHAWTYGLDGRFLGAPHMEQCEDFDKASYPLNTVNVDLWEGFIFLNLAENPVPLETGFAALAGKFTHWNLPKLRSTRRIEYDVRA